MPYHPSRRLERLFTALLPPAAREHVLGDLAECAETRPHYLAAFAAVLPAVVVSEVRRKLRAESGLGLMAGVSAVAMVVAALVTRGRALAVPGEWLRWAAPWTVWVAGCALAAAYGAAGTRLWNGWGVLGALLGSIGTAALVGAHVTAAATALAAAALAHIAITLPRAAADLARLAGGRPPLSLDNLEARAREFQRRIWWRNVRESAAGVLVLGASVEKVVTATSGAERIGSLLTAAGVLCVVLVLHAKARSRRVPDRLDAGDLLKFHREELARQRDILRRVPLWYLLPLAPGMLVGVGAKGHAAAAGITLVVMSIVFYMVARLNQWGARWLDRELAEARALAAPTGTRDRSAES